MNKKIICLFICFLFLDTIFPLRTNAYEVHNLLDGGWIEVIDGVTILHINGSNYEMGYQHGYLLKDKIEQNYRALFSLDNGEIYSHILELWNNSLKKNIPQEYINEIQGLADGSEQSIDNIVVFSIGLATYLFDSECMEMSAWNSATKDGKLIHLRSYDIPLYCQDTESGLYIQENQIIIIRKPDNGYLSLYPSFAGDIFGRGGINEKGIAVSSDSSPSSDLNFNATWFSCRLLMILDKASNVADSLYILNSSKHGGANYIVSDGKTPIAYIFEETANFSYIGTWDNPIEDSYPFWEIRNVVRRKNFFIHPNLASTQRSHYDPRIYFLLGFLPQYSNWFSPWRFYRTISLEIEKLWGNLDLNNTMDILRLIYQCETDFLLNIYCKLGLGSFYACHQWIACPEIGDFIISFADNNSQAQFNQVHYFNLYELA